MSLAFLHQQFYDIQLRRRRRRELDVVGRGRARSGLANLQRALLANWHNLRNRCVTIEHRDGFAVTYRAKILTRTVSDPNGSAGVGFRPTGELTVKDATIAEFASFLQRYVVDRPVVDKSGIPGKYDIALKWAPDEYQFGGNAKVDQGRDAGDLPDLFTAIQQQLGLRMQSGRSLVDAIVIDHVQKPTDN